MEYRGEEDESVVVNAAQISGLDERTLACTPVPVISSSAMRPRQFKRPRTLPQPKVLWENSNLAMAKNEDGDCNESLGLIPSHLLSGKKSTFCMGDSDLLPLDSLGSGLHGLIAPQANDGSAGSSCSTENAVAGAGSSTWDSGKLLTVLKSSQMKSAEGRLVPQTLFQNLSPLHAQIEEEAEDTPEESKTPQVLEEHSFARVLNRVGPMSSTSGGVQMSAVTTMEEGDADHTIHQVALEAEDLEELEEVCFDLDGSFSEEEPDNNKDGVHGEKSCRDQPYPGENAFPSILYKPKENVSSGPPPEFETAEGRLDSSIVDASASEYGASLVFGPSLQLNELPSKDIGFNPFGGEPASFGEEVFGEEEFNFHMDEDGAKAFLEQDEQAFNKDNLLSSQELSLVSARGTDDTFLNMTIGTYMKAYSEPLGHLSNVSVRPDFGLKIQSPVTTREVPPELISENDNSVRLSPLGGSGSKASSPASKESMQSAYSSVTSPNDNSQATSKAESQPATSVPKASGEKSTSHKSVINRTEAGHLLTTPSTDTNCSSVSTSSTGVSDKTEKANIPHRMVAATSNSQEPDNMELTFSPLQELLERSDFSVSAMAGPGQDHGEFILEFLRQRTLEKRRQAENNDGKDTRSLADSGIDSSKHGLSKQCEDTSSLIRSKHSTEGASGDADRLKLSSKLDQSSLSSDLHVAPSSEAVSKTTLRHPTSQRPAEKNISQTKDYKELGDEENKSFYREHQREDVEDKTLGLNDLTLSESSMFKVPLPITSKTANNKTKPSPFRSKIPRQTGAALTGSSRAMKAKSVENNLTAGPNSSVSISGSLQRETSNYNQSALVKDQAVFVETNRIETSYSARSALQEAPTERRGLTDPITNTLTSHSVASTSLAPKYEPVKITSPGELAEPVTDNSRVGHPRTQTGIPSMRTQVSTSIDNQADRRSMSGGGWHQPSLQQQTQRKTNAQSNADLQVRLVENDQYLMGVTSSLDTLTEETILQTMLNGSETTLEPLVTPKIAVDLVKLPDELSTPQTCCVSLSTLARLPISNLMPRGIKCALAVTAVQVTLEDGRQQRISPNRCPFDFKREITLAPRSKEHIQVIFQPKGEGVFTAQLEVTATSMAETGERRVYSVTLSGAAEYPTLEMWPASEKIDFGDMMYGSSDCKSIRIKNVGQATVPLCFSLFRTDSSPGLFSFHPENPEAPDISSISLTSRPSGAAGVSNSIFSMSLPGRVEGQEVKTETVKIYCNTLALDKRDQNRYLTQDEKFYARLQVSVDQPVEELAPLATVSLRVNVGMYKLKVDTSELFISAAAGSSSSGTLKLFNTGSIVMPVRVFLETSNPHFSVSPSGDVLVPPSGGRGKDHVPIYVTFTPQSDGETDPPDQKVNLMFRNQVCDHYIQVTGRSGVSPTRDSATKVTAAPVKLSVSTLHLSFGGVHIGHTGKEKLSFIVDRDVVVFVSIQQTGKAFMLVDPDREMTRDGVELSAVRSKKQTVWVMFEPGTVACYSASLIIHSLHGKRYTITLSGYGGCSSLHLEQLNLAHSETSFWLDMGRLSAGHSIFKKFVVRNQGSRCGFVKASFCDASRSEFLPTRATVMPSSLLLQPGEAKELLTMFCPSEKELALCNTGHALVGIIKLEHGDNILREMFLRNPGQQARQVISLYDVLVPSTLRDVIEAELVGMIPVPNTYTALRKSTHKINIGVFGEASREEGKTSTNRFRPPQIEAEKLETRQSTVPLPQQMRSTPSPRPALTPLNQNLSLQRGSAQIVSFPATAVQDSSDVSHTFQNPSMEETLVWQLDPFAPAYVKVSPQSQEVQPAGHSVFAVSPLKGTLRPGRVQTVTVRFSPQQPGSYNQVWTVMDAKCPGKQIQIHKFTVFAQAVHQSPTRLSDGQPDLSLPSRRNEGDESNSARYTAPTGESSKEPVKGNEIDTTQQSGARQSDLGSSTDQGHIEDRVRQRPFWSSVESAKEDSLDLREPRVVSPALSSISGTSSAARRAGTPGSSSSSSPVNSRNSSLNCSGGTARPERQTKGLHLIHATLEFPSLVIGSSSVHKLFIKNQSLQDAEVSVECAPGPPFLVKHLKFKVSCGKITIFPVTFKPRHVDKFKDRIVFRDSVTGKLLTATLLAESKES